MKYRTSFFVDEVAIIYQLPNHIKSVLSFEVEFFRTKEVMYRTSDHISVKIDSRKKFRYWHPSRVLDDITMSGEHNTPQSVATVQSLADILALLQQLQANQATRADLQALRNDVARLQSDVNQLSSRVGVVFEATMRVSIERRWGLRYAQNFEVESLYGLARLAMPKKDQLPDYDSAMDETQLLNKYVTALRNFIFDEKLYTRTLKQLFGVIGALDTQLVASLPEDVREGRLQLNSQSNLAAGNVSQFLQTLDPLLGRLDDRRHTEPTRKKDWKRAWVACSKISEFLHKAPHERPSYIEGNSRAGVLFFCSILSEEPILSLEIDCRGLCEIAEQGGQIVQVHIEIGEVKSSLEGNEAKAKLQLQRRLAAIGHACWIIRQKPTPHNLRLIGRIFSPQPGHKQQMMSSKSDYLPDLQVSIVTESL